VLTEIDALFQFRKLFFCFQLPGQCTDPRFDSAVLRSTAEPNAFQLPRVLFHLGQQNWISLEHPFPVIALPSHLNEIGDQCVLCANGLDFAIFGDVVCLEGGVFQNRPLLETEFIFRVCLIDSRIGKCPLSVSHPSGQDFTYGDIPVGSSYIFRKDQISFIRLNKAYVPVLRQFFLNTNGFQEYHLLN
jgi:hypothetical protein